MSLLEAATEDCPQECQKSICHVYAKSKSPPDVLYRTIVIGNADSTACTLAAQESTGPVMGLIIVPQLLPPPMSDICGVPPVHQSEQLHVTRSHDDPDIYVAGVMA
jgi:hypothetical protein